ncbi:MAG: sugar ABC transporter permease [Chloroflexi bacterium]|nr:MAG: sugar ABC transporter permease [Chloroflexota bacterium]
MAQLSLKGAYASLTKNEAQREALAAYLFILPTLIGFLVFIIGPIIAAVFLSFTSYDLLTPPKINGIENYSRLFTDPRLRTVYWNTIFLTFLAVIGNNVVGLALAVLINQKLSGPLRYFFRTAYFFPVLIALAYCAIIWQFMFQKDTGLINYYLGLLGVAPLHWLGNKDLVKPAVIILDVWKNCGFNMIIYMAGLQSIPQEYSEASAIDGANRWQIFRRITLPLISPSIFFLVIINMIGALQMFDSVVVLTAGGPGDASRTLVMFIYEQAFQNFRMGYASAVALTLFAVIMGLTLIQFRLSQNWVHYE